MKKKSIMFVCTGNTCRSPMAEIILKSKLKLAGIDYVKVSSAGLGANVGDKISKNSLAALKLLGYKGYAFKSKQLTAEMVKKTDLVICMTERHKLCLQGYKNVCCMSEITGRGDVMDPYGGDLNVYISTSYQIEEACNIILNEILQRKGE